MGHFTKMVSMAKTPEQINKEIGPAPSAPMSAKAADVPTYPWGLCINLEDEQIEKLKLDDECEVGDTIHFCVEAEVTSESKNKTEGGPRRRIELQITALAVDDGDADDAEDAEEERTERAARRYGGEKATQVENETGSSATGGEKTKGADDAGEMHLRERDYA